MKNRWKLSAVIALVTLMAAGIQAEPSKNFKVFLCFGQSNMSGGTQVGPDDASKKTNPRIKVLAFYTCPGPSRTTNQWYDAFEPMHCGDGINSMGPSYAFGQAIVDSLPNDTIGLIPAGLWGVSIEMFMKGGTNKSSSKPSMIGNNAWDWMVTKCKKAMERGVFSGIILEQGESNSGDGDKWLTSVKTIYNDLKSTLSLTRDVPIVAGELLQASGACCAGLNPTIDKMPQTFPEGVGYFASSKDLKAGGDQKQYHFDQAGYRLLGQRFAVEMMKGLRKLTPPSTIRQRLVSAATVKTQRDNAKIYSLSGRFVSSGAALTHATALKAGGMYAVADKKGSALKLMIAPTQR
jgi:hypothetical protein